jgi:hypothetical protein
MPRNLLGPLFRLLDPEAEEFAAARPPRSTPPARAPIPCSPWRRVNLEQAHTLQVLPGIYVLYRNRRIFYVGQSQNLRQRLMRYAYHVRQLQAGPVASYGAAYCYMPRSTAPGRVAVERRVRTRLRRRHRLTNIQREMEALL